MDDNREKVIKRLLNKLEEWDESYNYYKPSPGFGRVLSYGSYLQVRNKIVKRLIYYKVTDIPKEIGINQ